MIAIVICPFCSLLTLAHEIKFPTPHCQHVIVPPPVDNAAFFKGVIK